MLLEILFKILLNLYFFITINSTKKVGVERAKVFGRCNRLTSYTHSSSQRSAFRALHNLCSFKRAPPCLQVVCFINTIRYTVIIVASEYKSYKCDILKKPMSIFYCEFLCLFHFASHPIIKCLVRPINIL